MVIQNSLTFSKFSPWVIFFQGVCVELSTLKGPALPLRQFSQRLMFFKFLYAIT
jgi:hypothetical protein